jgi:hypothetical protein
VLFFSSIAPPLPRLPRTRAACCSDLAASSSLHQALVCCPTDPSFSLAFPNSTIPCHPSLFLRSFPKFHEVGFNELYRGWRTGRNEFVQSTGLWEGHESCTRPLWIQLPRYKPPRHR